MTNAQKLRSLVRKYKKSESELMAFRSLMFRVGQKVQVSCDRYRGRGIINSLGHRDPDLLEVSTDAGELYCLVTEVEALE